MSDSKRSCCDFESCETAANINNGDLSHKKSNSDTRNGEDLSIRRMLMKVGAILSQKGRKVITVKAYTKLMDVSHVLANNKIGCIVVVDDDENVVGVISERDIVRGLGDKGPEILTAPVVALMTEKVITCSEQDTVDDVMALMSTHRFRHMPVVENGQLVGIISIGDAVKTKIASAELEAEAMRDYIVARR